MNKSFDVRFMKKLIPAFCLCLLALAFVLMPAEADAASSEAEDVLSAVEAGSLDGMEIETIEIPGENLNDQNFSDIVQRYLDYAKPGNAKDGANKQDNIITRIVIPDGKWQPTNGTLKIYSNTILDLRGSGASTPLDTSDDYDNVTIYQSSKENDALSLRCGHQDKNGGDESHGFGFYKNMTVLGGTIVGKRKNGSTGGTTCNVRFGHATNVRIIGTQITDNHGAHHLEIGGCKDVLVSDCRFSHYSDGEPDEESSAAKSLEAIQLDVTHQHKNNFAYFGANDDLPVENAVITDCYFEDVVRGVGTHHAVFGEPYNNIVVKNNTFTNIHDKAIHFLYTRNCTIADNIMDGVYSGILYQYMYPEQQYMPNNWTASQAKEFNAGDTQIYGNTIHIDDSMTNHTEGGADRKGLVKFGIRVGGEYIASKLRNLDIKHPDYINAGNYYLSGNLMVDDNTVDVVKGGKKSIRAGIMVDYAKSCSVSRNTVNLKGCNQDGYAGIFVPDSYNVGVVDNVVSGVTNGTKSDGINLIRCKGDQTTMIQGNTVNNAKQYGISCNNTTNKNLSIYKNTVINPVQIGVTVFGSTIKNVSTNTIKMTNGSKMTQPAIRVSTGSTVNAVSYNVISGTKRDGIMIVGKSKATYISRNKITSPLEDGILINDSSQGTYVNYNTITGAGRFGITVSAKSYAQEILGNTIKNIKQYGVLIGDNSSAYLIQANTLTSCKKRSMIINGKANAIVANKVTSCPNKNKPYLKKGMSFTKYKVNVTRGKTFKVPYLKANTKGGITWSSSNKKILTVNKQGTVKAVRKGTAFVKATRNGITVKAKVTVK